MARKPKDGAQAAASTAAPHTSQRKKREGPGAIKETAADIYRRQIANDPQVKEVKGATGLVFGGDHIHEQSKASARETEVTVVRPGEPPLGRLSAVEQGWLQSAFKCLVQIEDYRTGQTANRSGHCIFEIGRAYVQFQAPNYAGYLICEAVSGRLLPDIAAILTPEKTGRLIGEFGFIAPGRSPNFARHIQVESTADLACAARLAYRVFRDIYDVKSFDAATFKVWPSEAIALAAPRPREPTTRNFLLTIDKQPLALQLEAILALFGKIRTMEFAEGQWAPFVRFELEAPPDDMPTLQHIDFSNMSESEIVAALTSLPDDIADFAGFVRDEIEAIEKARSAKE